MTMEQLALLAREIEVEHGYSGGRLTRRLCTSSGTWDSSREALQSTGDSSGDWWKAFLTSGPTVAASALAPVTIVDLFSSVGGLSLGFAEGASALGRRVQSLAAADLDQGALQVYGANHPGAQLIERSVRGLVDYKLASRGRNASYRRSPSLAGSLLEPYRGHVDAILAGPPCQGHSSLNNHTRGDDIRNLLYDAAVATAIAVEAPLVVIENVASVVRDAYEVIPTATSLLERAGYIVRSGVISAAKLGWPQTRRRHFLVASRFGAPLAPESLEQGLGASQRSVAWGLSDLPTSESDSIMSRPPDLSDENQKRIKFLFEHDLYELPDSERPECHRQGTTYRASYGRLQWDQPAGTITTGFMTPGRGRYVHPSEPRALTPREGARLQGFPDTFRFWAGGKEPTRGQLAKWIGDAVPSPLGFAASLAVLATLPCD